MSSLKQDEDLQLVTRALYVEPLTYPIDLNSFPSTGHEYIHMQRMQNDIDDANDVYVCEEEKPPEISPERQKLYDFKARVASHFRHMTDQLVSNKKELKKKFPTKVSLPIKDEVYCCTFCLGSAISDKIYSSEVDNKNFCEGNLPLLSIVLHLSQWEVVTLLKYLYKWYEKSGTDDALCGWVYALLVCLERPISDECEKVLLKFYENFIEQREKCYESDDEYQYQFFCSILESYFLVHTFTVGPSLKHFRVKSF